MDPPGRLEELLGRRSSSLIDVQCVPSQSIVLWLHAGDNEKSTMTMTLLGIGMVCFNGSGPTCRDKTQLRSVGVTVCDSCDYPPRFTHLFTRQLAATGRRQDPGTLDRGLRVSRFGFEFGV